MEILKYILIILLCSCSTTKYDSKQWIVVDKVVNDSVYRFSIQDGEWVTRIYYKSDSAWTVGDTLILQKK